MRYRLLAAAAGFVLSATAALAQQPPAPPADVRALASGVMALESQVSGLRASLELYVQRQAQESDARAAREKAVADYWAAFVAGLKR